MFSFSPYPFIFEKGFCIGLHSHVALAELSVSIPFYFFQQLLHLFLDVLDVFSFNLVHEYHFFLVFNRVQQAVCENQDLEEEHINHKRILHLHL